ncbi:MAG TPA: hypothetical protein VLT33_52080, partial [Labilithrix sp.]|nr:hypothetical protein [Labilithrix sp.]
IDGGDPPGVQLIGRFEADGANFSVAYPGSKLIARFSGTDATVKLTQTDGSSTGHSWFNVIVDGVPQAKLEVNGTSVDYPVAVNLAAGAHVVELEKRTESIFGVVRYEGFTFPNGGVLLGPPARKARRIEFLSDSTIDGYGVEGNLNPAAVNYCGPGTPANNYGAPAGFSNARKSMPVLTATALGAETFLVAYSGKGLTVTSDPMDALTFPLLYERTLPDVAGSAYGFGLQADAVVVSLGGVDLDGLSVAPGGFATAYGGLVDKVRLHYPGAWIFLTVWAQIKDNGPTTRTAMKNALQSVIDARAADTKLSIFQFPESSGGTFGGLDESGCQFHANEGLHASMATLLTAEIKAKLGW